MQLKSIVFPFALLAANTPLAALQAADVTWDNGAGDGFWTSAANWNPLDTLPGTADTAIIGGTGNINATGAAPVDALRLTRAVTISNGTIEMDAVANQTGGNGIFVSNLAGASATIGSNLNFSGNTTVGTISTFRVESTGTTTINGTVTAGSNLGQAGSKFLDFSGGIVVGQNATLIFNGAIANTRTTGNTELEINRGTVEFNAANTWTNAGSLRLFSVVSNGTGTLKIGNGGALGASGQTFGIGITDNTIGTNTNVLQVLQTGTNTVANGINIRNGALTSVLGADIASGTAVYSGAMTLSRVATAGVAGAINLKSVQAGGTVDFTGVIQDTGAGTVIRNLTIGDAATGLGTVRFTRDNTYAGSTTLNAGRLIIAGNHTGAGQLVVNNAGILQFGDSSSVNGSSVNSGTIFVNNTGTVQLNKTNGGTLTNAVASNPGTTTTLSGTNAAGTTNTFTATSFNNGGGFATNSTNAGATLAFSSASGAIDLKGTSLTVGGAGDTLFTSAGQGIYSSTGGTSNVTKNGAGNLIYQGNQGYTGTTAINAGAVRVDTAQTNGGTYFVGNGGTTTTAASLLLGGGATGLSGGVTFDRAVSLNAGSSGNRVIGGTNTSGLNTYISTIPLIDNNATFVSAPGGTVAFNTISAPSLQTAAVGTSGNTGTVRMGGTADNLNLAATVNFGTLELDKASNISVHAVGGLLTINSGATARLTGTGGDQIFNSSNATVNSGGVLDLNGLSETVAVLNLSGTGIGSGGALINNNGITTSTVIATGGIALGADTTIGGTANIVTPSAISGVGFGLTKTGPGTLTLSGVNNYSGATNISAGTLSLTGTGELSGTSSVIITGGTLLLGGSNKIAAAPFTTGGGAKIELNAGSNFTETVGSLDLLSGSTVIDFGGMTGINKLMFAPSVWSGLGTLQVWNWSGNPTFGNGTDQLFFGSSTAGLTGGTSGAVEFFTGSGTGSLGYGSQLSSGELVPVPEASSLLAALSLVGLAFRRDGRHRRSVSQ